MGRPENPRKQPRQARSRGTVDAILEAAARVFERHGYDGATTNRVAEVAGISIGSLYQYFPNKDALLTALHERHTQEVLAEVLAALEDGRGAPMRAVLRPLVRRVLRVHRAGPSLQRVLHTERPWLERAAADSEASLRLFAATREWLGGRQDVTVRDLDVAAMTVLRVIEALVHGAVLEPGGADDEALTAVIAEVVEGYLVLPR